MSLRKLLFLLIVSITASYADTVPVYFTVLPVTYVNATYVGFAGADVNNVADQYLICDDDYHTTYVPTPGGAADAIPYDYSTVAQVASAIGSTNVEFTTGNAVQNYEEAAVLVYNLVQAVPNVVSPAPADQPTVASYQYALWNLFDPSVSIAGDTNAQNDQATALAEVQSTDPNELYFLKTVVYSGVTVYTPSPTPSPSSPNNQEFLQYTAPAPEPGFGFALALLLPGMLIARKLRHVRA